MINRINSSRSVLLIICVLIGSCSVDRSLRSSAMQQTVSRESKRLNTNISGICSYYGKKFNGRKTENGEIYNMYKLTAAHKTLPFGTLLKITNLQNRKTVIVRINDRGPFVKGRNLDLSYAAAKKLNMLKTGTTKFTGQIIYLPDQNNLK